MKKILKITGIALAVILLVMILFPIVFQEKVRDEVKKLANRTLKSDLNFSDMSLSFFRHFPNLSLTLSDFSLMSSAPFRYDTLISARQIAFGVDVASLFGKTIRINRIYFDKARVNILYNEKGVSNYEIYQADTTAVADTSAPDGAELKIEHIYFTKCRITYADASLPLKVVAMGFNYSGKSQLTGDIFDLVSHVQIDSLDLVYSDRKYIDAKPVTAQLSTKVNTRTLTVNFEKNDLKIKDIPIQFHGKFEFGKEGYQVNLNFLSIMEKEFLSARFKIRQSDQLWLYAKANASIDMARWAHALDVREADVRGVFELSLDAEGYYSTRAIRTGPRMQPDTIITSVPKFTMLTRLTNGYLKYAALPQPLSNIGFKLNAACSDGNYRHISLSLEDIGATFLKNRLNGHIRIQSLEDLPVDAELACTCNLAELKEVIPMDSLTLAGKLSLDVKVNGNYAPEKKMFPVTTARVSLQDGSLQTKYYPHPIGDIQMAAAVTDLTGTMKDLEVAISPLQFRFEDQPFTLTAVLKDFDDLQYDLQSKGAIDLGKVYKVFSQKGLDLDGFIETDLSLKGRQSDAIAGRVARLENKGTLKLRDIAATTDLYPLPFTIRTGNFRFDQDKVWFDDFLASYGASDFRLKGYMQNTISYFLSQGGTLKGDFSLASDFIKIDEFMAFTANDSTSDTTAVTETGVVMIPHDLDVEFRAGIKKVNFSGLDIRDLKGGIGLQEGILVLRETAFNLIGCQVKMDATYGSVTAEKAFFDFHIKAEDFDIKRAYSEVAMVREMAPTAGKAEGIVSLDYSVKGFLDASLMPVMPSLEGGGVVSVKKVKVYGLKLFNDISKGTEKEGIKNPDITKVDIKSTIKKNTVTIEQFKFKVKGIRVRISGSTTFDQQISMKIRLGLGPLGIIGIPMRVTGTMDHPKIKYGKGGDEEKLKESDYSDTLPPEMMQRIRNAKEDDSDDGTPN